MTPGIFLWCFSLYFIGAFAYAWCSLSILAGFKEHFRLWKQHAVWHDMDHARYIEAEKRGDLAEMEKLWVQLVSRERKCNRYDQIFDLTMLAMGPIFLAFIWFIPIKHFTLYKIHSKFQRKGKVSFIQTVDYFNESLNRGMGGEE
jgi:hypothetical protein